MMAGLHFTFHLGCTAIILFPHAKVDVPAELMPSVLKSASVFSTVGRSTPLRNATSRAGSRFGSANKYHALLEAPANEALARYALETTLNLPTCGLLAGLGLLAVVVSLTTATSSRAALPPSGLSAPAESMHQSPAVGRWAWSAR